MNSIDDRIERLKAQDGGDKTPTKRNANIEKRLEIMLNEQGNRCAICSFEFSEANKPKLDFSGFVTSDMRNARGVLCTKCNTALTYFKDSQAILIKAWEYLERWRAK